MFQLSRICRAATLVFSVSLAAHAVAPSDGLEQRKQAVVRASLERVGRANAGAALIEASARADALLDIQIDTGAGNPVVTLQCTGQPFCKVFPFGDGRRIVVNLYDTVNLCAGKTWTPTNARGIQRVRTSLFALEPRFVSRAVIDLAGPGAFDWVQRSGAVVVALNGKIPASASRRAAGTEAPAKVVVSAAPEEPAAPRSSSRRRQWFATALPKQGPCYGTAMTRPWLS